ncbi:hypothetical protein J2Z21_009504 [Streptomyces griseochromogenes]|uniref:FAD-binding domain-containing protein n=1 Tax=Streptomyces griseochromogenes TaxID=68214 RepID=A0ABS4M9Y1_9ACTN|nr:hypothetical protein [Streptomyces griseochromogenes]
MIHAPKTVLVAGAGIAGPVAYWLNQFGMAATR